MPQTGVWNVDLMLHHILPLALPTSFSTAATAEPASGATEPAASAAGAADPAAPAAGATEPAVDATEPAAPAAGATEPAPGGGAEPAAGGAGGEPLPGTMDPGAEGAGGASGGFLNIANAASAAPANVSILLSAVNLYNNAINGTLTAALMDPTTTWTIFAPTNEVRV